MLTTIYCPRQLRTEWPDPLAGLWRSQYPHLFDDDDVRLANRQPRNHFAEWFVAIHLYHRDRAHCLVEKYLFGRHRRKQQLLRRLLDESQVSALEQMHSSLAVQPPDLLVFFPQGRRFWFAEAKGPGDKLSQKQRESHAAITKHFGVPVEVVGVCIADESRP